MRTASVWTPIPLITPAPLGYTPEHGATGAGWHDEGWVFTTATGAGLDQNNVGRAFRRVRERSGVPPLPIHSLRHATASVLLASGVPVAVAAKMKGHSVALFCETYADLLVEATRDAARQVDAFWDAQARPSGTAHPERRSPEPGRAAKPPAPRADNTRGGRDLER